ncbi:dynein assembly factor 5, axonemal [Pelomyxa schiedti]|nr:dynein assembly factor 5, axonemal [Pelomyxa schiedti]
MQCTSGIVEECGQHVALLKHINSRQRFKALENLTRVVSLDAVTSGVVESLVSAYDVVVKIIGCFSDPDSDTCREASVKLLFCILSKGGRHMISQYAPCLFPIMLSRLGNKGGSTEPTEEVRLAWLNVLNLIAQNTSLAPAHIDTVKAVLTNSFYDRCDEVRISACNVVSQLSTNAPATLCLVGDPLVRSILGMATSNEVPLPPSPLYGGTRWHANPTCLLFHKKFKIRLSAIAALDSIVLSGSVSHIDEIAVHMAQLLLQDSSSQVKISAIKACAGWVMRGCTEDDKIIPLLVAGVADQFADVRTVSYEKLLCLSSRSMADGLQPEPEPVTHIHYPPPFPGRPPVETRSMVTRKYPLIMSFLLSTASSPSIDHLIRSLTLLRAMIVFSESQIQQSLPSIIQFLCDMEGATTDQTILKLIEEVGCMVGTFSGPQGFLPCILPQIVQSTQRWTILQLLSYFMQGCSSLSCLPHLADLIPPLVEVASCLLIDSDMKSFGALVAVCRSLFFNVGSQWNSCKKDICLQALCLILVIHAEESRSESFVSSQSATAHKESFESFVASCGVDTLAKMIEPHFNALVEHLSKFVLQWNGATCDSKEAQIFAELLRCASASSLHQYEADLCGFLGINCNVNVDLKKRAWALTQLRTISEHNQLITDVILAKKVICEYLVPNLSWAPGAPSLMLRKIAIDCSRLILRKFAQLHQTTVPNTFSWLASTLSIYTARFDEEDDGLRVWICEIVSAILTLSSNNLSDTDAAELCKLLISRLDDNCNTVRVAVAKGPIVTFAQKYLASHYSAPSSQQILGDVTKVLLIHMDDIDQGVQEAAFSGLASLAQVDPIIVGSLAAQQLPKFRSPFLCTRLIALCTGPETQQNS